MVYSPIDDCPWTMFVDLSKVVWAGLDARLAVRFWVSNEMQADLEGDKSLHQFFRSYLAEMWDCWHIPLCYVPIQGNVGGPPAPVYGWAM